jgi:hypothetical protein
MVRCSMIVLSSSHVVQANCEVVDRAIDAKHSRWWVFHDACATRRHLKFQRASHEHATRACDR